MDAHDVPTTKGPWQEPSMDFGRSPRWQIDRQRVPLAQGINSPTF